MDPRGLAGATTAPMSVADEDLPPGAGGTYYQGPLANQPAPTPTPSPNPNSLSVLAAGGTNHQEAWMSGQTSPQSFPKQAPFSSNSEPDMPPGSEGTYYGGPLANPTPKPTPAPKSLSPDAIAHFGWGSAFEQPGY